MAKLLNFNGRYCESEFENAFISFLEEEGDGGKWLYMPGKSISRNSKRDVLYTDDLEQFLSKTNADLTLEEIQQIIDTVRLVGAESEFSTLHKVYGWMVNGIQFTPQSGLARMVSLIDFENSKNNILMKILQNYNNNTPPERSGGITYSLRMPRKITPEQNFVYFDEQI